MRTVGLKLARAGKTKQQTEVVTELSNPYNVISNPKYTETAFILRFIVIIITRIRTRLEDNKFERILKYFFEFYRSNPLISCSKNIKKGRWCTYLSTFLVSSCTKRKRDRRLRDDYITERMRSLLLVFISIHIFDKQMKRPPKEVSLVRTIIQLILKILRITSIVIQKFCYKERNSNYCEDARAFLLWDFWKIIQRTLPLFAYSLFSRLSAVYTFWSFDIRLWILLSFFILTTLSSEKIWHGWIIVICFINFCS